MQQKQTNQKKIINKYIARTFFKNMIFVMIALIAIIYLFSFLEKLKAFADNNNTNIFDVLYYTLLEVPLTFQTVIPFSILIAGQYFFFKFSKTSEIVILRSIGMSVWNIIMPIVKVVFITGVVYVVALNPAISKIRKEYIRMTDVYGVKETNEVLFAKGGLWIKEKNDSAQSFISAKEVRQKGNIFYIKEAKIYLFNNENKITKQISATAGTLDTHGLFKFYDTWIFEPTHPKQHLDYYEYNTELNPKELTDNTIYPDSIPFWKLPAYSKTLRDIGLSTKEYEMFFYKTIFIPLSFIAMIFLAMAFTLPRNNRNAKFLLRISGGISCGFIIYFMEQVFYSMGLASRLPQLLAVIAVPTICLMFSTIYIFFFEES